METNSFKNTAILINSCDAYSDVLRLNLCALEEYWKSCEFPIFVNTESKCIQSDHFNIYSIQYKNNIINDRWGRRFKNALNSIDQEFVIVIYDDYIIESEISHNFLSSIINIMSNSNLVDCFYLTYQNFKITFDAAKNLYSVDKDNYYRINSAPALWRKKVLLNLIEDNENPWTWEFFSMYKDCAKNLGIYSVPSVEQNIFNYNNSKGGAIYRGKWVSEVALPKIKKYNLNINIDDRGCINMDELSPRSLTWKIKFFLSGFKMVGFHSFNLFKYYFKVKFS